MSSKRKRAQLTNPPPPSAGKRWRRGSVKAILAAMPLLALVGFAWWLSRSANTQPPTSAPRVATAINRPAPPAKAQPDGMKLKGRWVRPDGGYVIEIKGVDDGGKLDAAYFNPGPIHVARAKASRDEAATRVYIELRDVNYPGSTYNLTYEPASDRLEGIYYQAALRQSYEVFFMRVQ